MNVKVFFFEIIVNRAHIIVIKAQPASTVTQLAALRALANVRVVVAAIGLAAVYQHAHQDVSVLRDRLWGLVLPCLQAFDRVGALCVCVCVCVCVCECVSNKCCALKNYA